MKNIRLISGTTENLLRTLMGFINAFRAFCNSKQWKHNETQLRKSLKSNSFGTDKKKKYDTKWNAFILIVLQNQMQ